MQNGPLGPDFQAFELYRWRIGKKYNFTYNDDRTIQLKIEIQLLSLSWNSISNRYNIIALHP